MVALNLPYGPKVFGGQQAGLYTLVIQRKAAAD